MGGSASKETGTSGIGTRPYESESTADLEDKDLCHRCFFFTPKLGKPKSDPIGTPLPPTPLFQRRARSNQQQALKQAARDRNGPLMSSRYGGLEKENSHVGLLSPMNGNGCQAQVYEGPDAEQALHAEYELLETLGVGSTSTCLKCVNRVTGVAYACKVIDKQMMEDRFQGMMHQFRTEIEALRNLQHPNIIRLYNVYVSEEKIFIVMELMQGGELFDYVVERGTLTEGEASKIVRSVTSALVYMHSKNIIHRDLKPENLLLRQKPSKSGSMDVKIIDFGLSKQMVEEPVARSFLGTRGYLAPEMLQRRDYSREVDTWALGVIVFVLLCGCLPFDDDSQTVPSDALVQKRFVLRFPRWASNLSKSAKDLLSHLLDVNPQTRYTAEQALRHPWVTGEAAPKNALLQSPRMIRKSPRLNLQNGTPKSPQSPSPQATYGYGGKQYIQGGSSSARQMVRKTSI